MKKSGPKIENPKLLVLLSLFFVLSILLTAFGINRVRQNLSIEKDIRPQQLKESDEESEESLSEFFENAKFSSEEGGTDEYFLEKDPFKDICAEGSGDGQVSISFGTVCYR